MLSTITFTSFSLLLKIYTNLLDLVGTKVISCIKQALQMAEV